MDFGATNYHRQAGTCHRVTPFGVVFRDHPIHLSSALNNSYRRQQRRLSMPLRSGYDTTTHVMTTAKWQHIMKQVHGIGVLATIEGGAPRLRPMEFSLIHGELWAATSKQSRKYSGVPDGQHVEVLFMNEEFDHARVRGVLEWSTEAEDRQQLWEQQQHDISTWYSGVDDPNLVILKIIPEQAEYKSSHGPDRYQQEAA